MQKKIEKTWTAGDGTVCLFFGKMLENGRYPHCIRVPVDEECSVAAGDSVECYQDEDGWHIGEPETEREDVPAAHPPKLDVRELRIIRMACWKAACRPVQFGLLGLSVTDDAVFSAVKAFERRIESDVLGAL